MKQIDLLKKSCYYPFGLIMQGISSKVVGRLENRYKFNDGTELQNNELSDGSGLELYATDFRSYDPQLGRLWQVDPLAEVAYNNSPYVYASNNPILINDPTGLTDSVRRETSTPEQPKPIEEVRVTGSKRYVRALKLLDKISNRLGWTGLGWSMYEALKLTGYLGDWRYRNSAGVVQSIFDTKWGRNKTPGNLGNINNYSKNAQAAIRGTKVVKVVKAGSKVLIWVGVVLDGTKLVKALANNDPKAGEYARKMSLNTGVAFGTAAIPIAGWMIGAVYFLGDALIPGGWEAAAEASLQNVQHNREIDRSWSPRPMGGML